MNTVKTAAVVVLLLAVLYGVYVVLNKPEGVPPQDVAWEQEQGMAPPEIDFGVPSEAGDPSSQAMPITPPQAEASSSAADLAQSNSATLSPPSPTPPSFGELQSSDQSPAHSSVSAHSEIPQASGEGARSSLRGNRRASDDEDSPPSSSSEDDDHGPDSQDDGDSQFLGVRAFEKAWRTARGQIESEQWHEALFTLSIFYNSPDLTAEENRRLLQLLDPLAGKVIYSNEHLLEPAYEVRRGETLMDIAERYKVPWQLLQNINGIEDPRVLVPNTPLKVVPGPFRAEIDLELQELTLFVGRLYAGRFPIGVGSDPAAEPGEYQVRDKQQNRPYYSSDGQTIEAGDSRNPYGHVWLDLGGELAIHGSPEADDEPSGELGCISLSPIDAADVYGILSLGSKVLIYR